MYLVGAAHAHKADAQRLLESLISDRQRLVTDAEVLQEILQRYVAINRRDAIQPAFDALLGIAEEVLAVDRATAEGAKETVMGHRQMSADLAGLGAKPAANLSPSAISNPPPPPRSPAIKIRSVQLGTSAKHRPLAAI
jgi:hypothetical protein